VSGTDVLTCACGRVYSLAEWQMLPFVGRMDVEEDGDARLELRNCTCGSTFSREIPPPSPGALPWSTTGGEEYGVRIDAVLRTAHLSEFSREEWVKLAYAALDQAGATGDTLEPIGSLLERVCLRAAANLLPGTGAGR
jgi:hypothetical protein